MISLTRLAVDSAELAMESIGFEGRGLAGIFEILAYPDRICSSIGYDSPQHNKDSSDRSDGILTFHQE